MAIAFSCDCGQEFKVSDSHAGKRIKCQGCGSAVKIPALPKKTASDSGSVAVGKPGKKKTKRVSDEEEDPLVHSVSDYGEDEFDFDLGKIPMGKPLEEDDPDLPMTKKKSREKAAAAKADKPKKVKKRDEDAANPLLVGAFVVLGLCSMSALGYFGYQKFGGGGGDTTPLEKKFVVEKGPENVWSYERPDDWEITQSGGGTGGKPPVVLIEGEGSAAIFRIRGSMGGSAIASISQAGGAGGIAIPGADDGDAPVGEDLTPETAVHMFQQDLFKADYSEFEEEPMQKLKLPFGEARMSVFTAKEGFLSPRIKGYRVTFLDNNWQYNLRAYAPEKQWDKFEPTFKRMIMSISR